ncbi:hypothetical protein ABT299_28480 [Spirillospora sp. NPDC000708]
MSSEGPPARSGKRRREFFPALGAVYTFFGLATTVFSGRLLSMPAWGLVLLLLGFLFVGFVAASVLVSDLSGLKVPAMAAAVLARAFRLLYRAVRWSWPGIAAALAVGLVIFKAPVLWAYATSGGSCAEPIDLRVVTDAENVAPLAEAARRYAAERADHGCREVTINVAGDAPTDEIKNGFARGWTSPGAESGGGDCSSPPSRATLLGAQPDVWIPDSLTIAKGVRDDVDGRTPCSGKASHFMAKADLEIGHAPSVGSSPLVLAVFGNSDRPDLAGDPGRQSLESLVHELNAEQVLTSVARPSPDTSDSALLATPLLHQALRTGWAGGDKGPLEKIFDESNMSGRDAVSLVCGFRAKDNGGESPPQGTAVILPESVLARYDHGDALGAGCPGRKPSSQWWLYPYYTNDLPVLDYPFVHVRWPGEDSARRDKAVAAFRKWLGKDEFAKAGLRTASGRISAAGTAVRSLRDPRHPVPESMPPHPLRGDGTCLASLQALLGCYGDARPKPPVGLLIDVSGSMANTVGQNGPSLGRAQALATRILADTRPTAPTSLFFFSRSSSPEAGPVASSTDEAGRLKVAAALQRAVTNDWDMPLTTAIRQAVATRLPPGKKTLVVLTDGQAPASDPGAADQARELAGTLRSEDRALHVLIVLTGQSDCTAEPVASIAAAFGRDSCIGGPSGDIEDLAPRAVARILWGDD